MKLIIDIPEEEYKHTCEMRLHNRTYYDDAIRNGTPFDSVIEDIKNEIADEMILPMADVGLRVALEIIDKHIKGGEQ